MNKEDLLEFIGQFNKVNGITTNNVFIKLKELYRKKQELMVILINYVKGGVFVKKLHFGVK